MNPNEHRDEGEVEGEFVEDMDPETQASIERGFAQSEREEGRSVEEVREEIRKRFNR